MSNLLTIVLREQNSLPSNFDFVIREPLESQTHRKTHLEMQRWLRRHTFSFPAALDAVCAQSRSLRHRKVHTVLATL